MYIYNVKQKQTNKMQNFRLHFTRERLETVILRSTDKFDGGSVCFYINKITSTYQDGTVKVETEYSIEDNRRWTDIGRAYRDYKNEKSYRAAIKRYLKKDDLELNTDR